MIPRTSLPVDGSERTLIWVEAIPSTRAIVAVGRGGSGVCDGSGVSVSGNVEVMIVNVGVVVSIPLACNPQFVQHKARTIKIKKYL